MIAALSESQSHATVIVIIVIGIELGFENVKLCLERRMRRMVRMRLVDCVANFLQYAPDEIELRF